MWPVRGSDALHCQGLSSSSLPREGVDVSSPIFAWGPLVEFPSDIRGLWVVYGAFIGSTWKNTRKGGYPWHRTHIHIPIYT